MPIDTDKVVDKVKENLQKLNGKCVNNNNSSGSNWFWDFLTFKIMIFPALITTIYIVSSIFWIWRGFNISRYDESGIWYIILGPIFTHLILEFAMVAFAILDTLREIRNELKDVKQNK